MNNYPIWWDSTLTIYNKYENKLTNQVTWYRYVITDCFWKYSGNKVTINDAVLDTNSIICRIPENENFRERYLWINIPGDLKENYFTLGQGDIIAYGEVDEEIDEYTQGQRSSDFLKKHKDLRGCMQVEGIALNIGKGRVDPHYWVRGI